MRCPRFKSRFSHAWLKELSESGARRLQESKLPVNLRPAISWRDVLREKVPTDALNQFIEYNRAKVTIPIPKAGPEAAIEKLKSFAHIVDHYVQDRDILDRDGTSDLSMFLKNGSITITQIINHLGLLNTKPTPGKVAFLRQLIWREFYFHILWHWPHSETESFNPKYRDLHGKTTRRCSQPGPAVRRDILLLTRPCVNSRPLVGCITGPG